LKLLVFQLAVSGMVTVVFMLGHKFVPPIFEATDGSQDAPKVRVALHLFGVPDFPSLVSVQFRDPAHDAAQAVLKFADFMLSVHFWFFSWRRVEW